jgi:hypothetical protein
MTENNIFQEPKILVRVDDFPHHAIDSEKFVQFDKIMKKYEIPYLLGVTPFICKKPAELRKTQTRLLSKQEINYLKKIVLKEKRVVLAQHGITHKTIRRRPRSEFIGMDEKEFKSNLKKSIIYLKKFGFSIGVFIPPFNTFDIRNIQILKKYFKIITGGPESIRVFGKLPIGNLDGVLYIPSYPPLYLKAHQTKIPIPKELACLTIHWAWFNKEEIEAICKKIKPYVVDWNNLKVFK